jgi:O-phospho-L-seryl-tRNASec:L-selenocysteinyl-tRNA synthase
LEAIEAKVLELGAENILAVFSTTSCFAPRAPDRVDLLAQLAARHKLYHVVNNAYGLQCPMITQYLEAALK